MTIIINKLVTDKRLMPITVLFFTNDRIAKITEKKNKSANTGKKANIPIEKKSLIFRKGRMRAMIKKSKETLSDVLCSM